MKNDLFEHTQTGYVAARQWLTEIGEFDHDYYKYESMSAAELIDAANSIKEKQVILHG